LGPETTVAVKQNGTIVALLPGDREDAERAAAEVVEDFETRPTTRMGHGVSVSLTLACGVIAFPPAGPPLAQSIAVPMLEAGPAPSPAPVGGLLA
jgi:hypothetical protein